MMHKRTLLTSGPALFAAWLGLTLLLTFPVPSFAQSVATDTAGVAGRTIEPRALAILKQMSDFLVATPRFVFEAEEVLDEIPDGQPRVQFGNLRRVAFERPQRLAADATGDTLNRTAWYDGRKLTVYDKAHNTWASLDQTGPLDDALDRLHDDYGVTVPLADFLYSDPYAVLTEGITYGRYVGIHRAAGVPCHHLVFAQDTVEWQLWVDAGAEPLPRKLVLTYVHEPGEPQYTATFQRWRLSPNLPEELFTFTPPEGARRVELTRLIPGGAASQPAAATEGDQP